METLAAYFDVSGKPKDGDRAFAVAGFASSVTEWKKFSIVWAEILAGYKLPEWHMVDIKARHLKPKLSHISDADYIDIFKSLVVLLEAHACKSFVRLIEGADLAAVRSSGQKPLVVAGTAAIRAVHDWSVRRKKPGALHCEGLVFDDGEEDRGALTNASLPGMQVPVFRDSAKALPLQAADWLAWEMARLNGLHIQHRGHGSVKMVKVRGEVHAAIRHLPRDWKYYDDGAWIDIVADHHVRRGRYLRKQLRHRTA